MAPTNQTLDDHDQGLAHDLTLMKRSAAGSASPATAPLGRRRALQLLGGGVAGVALLAACEPAIGTVTGGGLVKVPEETAGPFPGDGSNGPNVLSGTGVVRRDIRSSFGSSSGTAGGVPLTVHMTILDLAKSGAAYAGAAVYVWHCDRESRYSLYSAGVTDQNYLRGVQAADRTGTVTFKTIYPGCYPGRWPHIHFEIYPTLAKATNVANKVATSQLALPAASSEAAYATAGYSASRANLAHITPQTDMVFRDGTTHERPDISGDPSKGFVASIVVAA